MDNDPRVEIAKAVVLGVLWFVIMKIVSHELSKAITKGIDNSELVRNESNNGK